MRSTPNEIAGTREDTETIVAVTSEEEIPAEAGVEAVVSCAADQGVEAR